MHSDQKTLKQLHFWEVRGAAASRTLKRLKEALEPHFPLRSCQCLLNIPNTHTHTHECSLHNCQSLQD